MLCGNLGWRNDWTSMAVSLSTNAVKLYSPVTGQYYGECKGHSETINHISFSGPSTPNVLHSCSSDGTIRAWDTRTLQQVACLYYVFAMHKMFVLVCYLIFGFGGTLLIRHMIHTKNAFNCLLVMHLYICSWC